MGYFSNGSEGMGYEERYCNRCRNWREDPETGFEGCAIMDIHAEYNRAQFGNTEESKTVKRILNMLIPSKDGYNQECRLFMRVDDIPGQMKLEFE